MTSFLTAVDEGAIAVVGAGSSSVSQITAIAGGVFEIPQLSYSSTAATLSNKADYPLFGRLVPPDNQQGSAFAQFVSFFDWGDTVAAISSADEYGVGGVDQFIKNGADLGVRLRTYQQFLSGATDIHVEMNELLISESRVFLAFLLGKDAQIVLENAIEFELIGDTFVWLCSDGCAQPSTYTDTDGEIIPRIRDASRGLIGLTPTGGTGELFEQFLDDWEERDSTEYPGAGDRTINLFAPHAYDSVWGFALAFDQLIKEERSITSDNIVEVVRKLDFTGITGRIKFDENGDRLATYDLVNLQDANSAFTKTGSWDAENVEQSETAGFIFNEEIQFFDGTTDIPDLDVRDPVDIWDCEKKKEFTDPTGKAFRVRDPDGDNPRYIAAHYRCDEFIDCGNLSDESFSCSPSFAATYLSFGILTGMFLLVIPFFAIAVISFGVIWKKRRIRLLSPIFMLGMCVAAFLGYVSTFAWYGKPHTVSCNFQPWLLGISVNLMIA